MAVNTARMTDRYDGTDQHGSDRRHIPLESAARIWLRRFNEYIKLLTHVNARVGRIQGIDHLQNPRVDSLLIITRERAFRDYEGIDPDIGQRKAVPRLAS
jgi:hypothetical protein